MYNIKPLILIYLILVVLSSFKVLPQNILIFGIAALIVSFLLILSRREGKEIKLSNSFLVLAFLLIFLTRAIPYISNDIPIGYDAGIYKYSIENKIDADWEKSTFEPVFNLLMKTLNLIFPSTFILIFFLILFELLTGFSIYITVKEYFDKNTAILSTLLYSLSIVQFKAFTFLYYKNMI